MDGKIVLKNAFKSKLWISLLLIFSLCLAGCTNKETSLKLHQLTNQTYSQMMSYVLETKNNEVIVIDGGTREDSQHLMDKIKEVNPEGHVKAWFLTHYHKDHTGALSAIIEGQANLSIETIYYQFPSDEWVNTNENNRYEDYQMITASLSQVNTHTIQKDETIEIGDIKIISLRNVNESIIVNAGNNSSLVYKVNTPNKQLLFLGDLGVEGGHELLEQSSEKIENMDYVQVAHHGQVGVSEEVYQVINPKYCLWPTTDWIWNNDQGEGPNSGTLKTKETKGWFSLLDVKEHYVADKEDMKIKVE